MSRHKKDKKAKAKEKAQAQLQENKVKFDIIQLLNEEQLDTKPNMGKFLKQYVKMIRGLNANSKICFYPDYKFSISKVFVKFLDGHELIYDMATTDDKQVKYFLYFETDELELKKKDAEAVEKFFNFLLQFNFVFSR